MFNSNSFNMKFSYNMYKEMVLALDAYNTAYNDKVNPMVEFVLRPNGTSYNLVQLTDNGYERNDERLCFTCDIKNMTKLLNEMTTNVYNEAE